MDHSTHGQDPKGQGEGGMEMKPKATGPEIAAVALLTVLALVVAVTVPAMRLNLGLSARDVGGTIMPPGMIMTRDTPGEAMRDMAAIDPRRSGYLAPAGAKGAQPIQPRLEGGVKVFDFEVSQIGWNILTGERVDAYAVNRQVPGPTVRVTVGNRVRFNVKNSLPESTSIHWHGMILPNPMDGVAEVTQAPIKPGGSFTYEFTTRQTGTYFYHSHKDSDRQQGVGLYGALIIDPKTPPANPGYDQEYTVQLQEWLKREGLTYPAMIMEGALPNFFTINGKAYPNTDTIRVRVGQRVLLRFIGSNNNFIHPMHVHGGPFEVVARDGETIQPSARFLADTVNVGPGQRYDVVWTAREPGRWLIHCHIPHHIKNNNVEVQGGGGLTMVIEVTG
ncbi:MAG: multicopper oxidase domain-containing protein [Thermaceae bacterium]|nr:multicopper oxidase domain-containing protein [Thermaceae bacterium]